MEFCGKDKKVFPIFKKYVTIDITIYGEYVVTEVL